MRKLGFVGPRSAFNNLFNKFKMKRKPTPRGDAPYRKVLDEVPEGMERGVKKRRFTKKHLAVGAAGTAALGGTGAISYHMGKKKNNQ